MSPRFLFISLVAFVTAAGCKRDSIQTYLAPKETTAIPLMSAGGDDMGGGPAVQESAPQTQPQVRWKTPAGWQEQPASSMRVGSFLIKGKDGQSADVSVVPLSGDAGGDLANINRWRGQIQLPPLTEEDLAAQSRTITSRGRSMRWVDFVGVKRVTAVIYKKGDQTWFFKMIGDDATVHEAQPAFRAFLNSLQFPS